MAAKDLYEKDLYAVLGVKKSDNGDAIKKQYRKLARELHPDKTKGDKKLEERFKEVSEAYEVLSDDKKRAEYEEMRNLFTSGQMPRGGYAGGPGYGQGGANFQGDFSQFFGNGSQSFTGDDIFSSLFGGSRRQPKGADYQVDTRISFHDSIVGKELSISFNANGNPVSVKTRVAPGIKDGAKLRLTGRGASGPGGNGDLYITVHVDPHPVFTRKNDDLLITVPITYREAVMGANIKVPTFDGELVTVKLSPGTSSGKTLRVKGRGVASGKHHGDLLVKVEIIVPQRIEHDAIEHLEKYSEIMDTHDFREELIKKAHHK